MGGKCPGEDFALVLHRAFRPFGLFSLGNHLFCPAHGELSNRNMKRNVVLYTEPGILSPKYGCGSVALIGWTGVHCVPRARRWNALMWGRL